MEVTASGGARPIRFSNANRAVILLSYVIQEAVIAPTDSIGHSGKMDGFLNARTGFKDDIRL